MLRRVLLLRKDSCPACGEECEKIVISDQGYGKFKALARKSEEGVMQEGVLAIPYELFPQIEPYYEIRCATCKKVFPSILPLLEHTKTVHKRYFCRFCLQFQRKFLSEQETFLLPELSLAFWLTIS